MSNKKKIWQIFYAGRVKETFRFLNLLSCSDQKAQNTLIISYEANCTLRDKSHAQCTT